MLVLLVALNKHLASKKKNLLDRTDAEKVFRPWWDTLEDYLLNILILIGQKKYLLNILILIGQPKFLSIGFDKL